MSARASNSAEERILYNHHYNATQQMIHWVDEEEDDVMSFTSFLSTDDDMAEFFQEALDEERDELYDTMEGIHCYGHHIYDAPQDESIDFDAPPLLIKDLDNRGPSTKIEFRFRTAELQDIADLLWPKVSVYLEGPQHSIKVTSGYCVPYETGFLVLLYRLTYPCRLRPEMEKKFCIRAPKLSCIIKTFLHAFYKVARKYFLHPRLFQHRFQWYADIIAQKSNQAVTNVWGFLDATFRRTCRPIEYQRVCYSGHKRDHGLKFQAVVVPEGFTVCLSGPFAGSRHDSYVLGESRLLQQLVQIMPLGGPIFSLFADSAYPNSAHLFTAFRNAAPGTPQQLWNTEMSRVRQSVEWGFANTVRLFSFLDFRRQMKIFQGKVGKYYIVGAFFANLHCCIYGNQISRFFGVLPLVPGADGMGKMTLEEYIDMV